MLEFQKLPGFFQQIVLEAFPEVDCAAAVNH